MKVYHGSDVKIETIDLNRCEDNKDFGKGFYVTNIKANAEAWARKMADRRKSQPVITEFEFWDGALESNAFRALRFPLPSCEWVEFVLLNRRNKDAHDYDIVEGPVADDWVIFQIGLYEAKKITMEELLKALTFHEPTHQICCCTAFALQALETVETGQKWNVIDISVALCDALVTNQGMDKIAAQHAVYHSAVFKKVLDRAAGFGQKPWTEIYALLLQEIDKAPAAW
jgi:hypothetical protein